MKISIIVPVYNSEKYLYKCIQSVVSQNPVECEMILVDDGSTDKSLDMMNKAAEKIPLYSSDASDKSRGQYGEKYRFKGGIRGMDLLFGF